MCNFFISRFVVGARGRERERERGERTKGEIIVGEERHRQAMPEREGGEARAEEEGEGGGEDERVRGVAEVSWQGSDHN